MGIKFFCDHCQQLLNIKSRYAGKDGSCPHCDKDIHVPLKSTIRIKRKFRDSTKEPAPHKPHSAVLNDEQKTVASFGETQEFDRDNIAPPISSSAAPSADRSKPHASESASTSTRSQTVALDKARPNSPVASRPELVASKSSSTHLTVRSPAASPQTQSTSPDPAAPNSSAKPVGGSFLLDKPTNPWLQPNAPDPIESGMKKVWYVRHPKNGELGPIKGKLITKMIANKEITPACYVWREDWEDWLRADVVFKQLELPKLSNLENDRVFTDPNCPIPKSYLRQATAEERQKKRQQILIVVAIIVGIVTICLLAWLLATLL